MKIAMKQVPKIFLIGLALLAGTGMFAGSVLAANSNDQSSMLQQRLITGTVTSAEDGSPMVGVTVIVKGTTIGTITNEKGEYSLDVPSSAQTLVFSFVGMKTQEVAIGTSNAIDVVMKVEATAMDEVVVTALGITRQKKALGYSIQEVGTQDVERTKENNVINTLAGKVAGIQINRSASGAAGTSRVVIRGNNSLGGNNSPLYVVDGIPIDNTQFGEAGMYGGIDQGDGLSTLNPADIESISVLKGANAAALYGSRASAGVILITTKTGKARRGVGVTLSTSYTWDTPLLFPSLQNVYGQGDRGLFQPGGTVAPSEVPSGMAYTDWNNDGSWGPKMEGQDVYETQWLHAVRKFSPQPNNMKDFFQTGHTSSSTIAISGGNEKITSRISFTNDNIAGIQPTNDVKRQTVNLRTTAKLSDRLTADAKITYTYNYVKNRPQMSDMQGNPAYNLTIIPRQIRTADLKNYYTTTAGSAFVTEHMWTSDTYKGNPYWTINKENTTDKINRLQGFLTLKYDFAKWLNLQVRAGEDRYTRSYLYYRARGTRVYANGNLSNDKREMQELNTDFLFTAHKEDGSVFNGFLTFGGNIYDSKYNYMAQSGTLFKVPDYYNISNTTSPSTSYSSSHKQIRSLYASGELSYKNYLYLDLTARNDWSSTLPEGNNSYFYPSATMSFIFTDAFRDLIKPSILSFGKIRASWAQVGSDTNPYSLYPYYTLYSDAYNGQFVAAVTGTNAGTIPNNTLKPEITSSAEVGADLRFLNNRLGVDFTYYSKVTKDQLLSAPISRASGSYYKMINAGKVTNKGIEILLTANPVKTSDFSWDITVNFSTNKNKVVKLVEGVPSYLFGQDRLLFVQSFPGEEYGNLRGGWWLRDAATGKQLVDTTGVPLANTSTSSYKKLGNYNPNWLGGIGNTFTYKGFSLYALIDIRMGGEFMSLSEYYMAAYGTSTRSLKGRAAWYASEDARRSEGKTSAEWTPTGGYLVNGIVAKYDAATKTWVSTGQKNTTYCDPESRFARGVTEDYIQDASFVKMRELSLSYELPRKLLARTPIQSASIGLVGRNCFFLYRACKDYDPESSYNSTNWGQGVENHAMPTTKSYGFSVKLSF